MVHLLQKAILLFLFAVCITGCIKKEDNTVPQIHTYVRFKDNGVETEFRDGQGYVDNSIRFDQAFTDGNGVNYMCPNRGVNFQDPTFFNFQSFALQFTNFCYNPIAFAEDPESQVLDMFSRDTYELTNTSFAGNPGVLIQYVNSQGMFLTTQLGVPENVLTIEKTGYIPQSESTSEKIFLEGSFTATVTDGWSTTSSLTEGHFLIEIIP